MSIEITFSKTESVDPVLSITIADDEKEFTVDNGYGHYTYPISLLFNATIREKLEDGH